MAEPFLGEIRTFSFSFEPEGWAFCDGRLLPIADNQALYAVIGATYGGDGVTTFALPDLRGRAPVHMGNGISLGEKAGEETHTLTVNEIPAHTHVAEASTDSTSKSAAGNVWGKEASQPYSTQANGVMNSNALSTAGSSQGHPNMQPYGVINYCMAIQGIFPSRN